MFEYAPLYVLLETLTCPTPAVLILVAGCAVVVLIRDMFRVIHRSNAICTNSGLYSNQNRQSIFSLPSRGAHTGLPNTPLGYSPARMPDERRLRLDYGMKGMSGSYNYDPGY